MEHKINLNLHNKWDIVVRDANTNQEVSRAVGYNIILNTFWDYFIHATNVTTNILGFIQFGSGTTAPSASNTALTAIIGGKAAGNEVRTYTDWNTNGIMTIQRSCRLEASEYNGTTIGEVGFATAAASGLRTHSLIKDQNGNAITIAKTDTVVIDIYGTFYINAGGWLNSNKAIYRPTAGGALNGRHDQSVYQFSNGRTLSNRWPFSFGTTHQSNITPTADVANKRLTYTINAVNVGDMNLSGGLRSANIAGFTHYLPASTFAQPAITKEVVGTGNGSVKDFATDFGFILDNSTAKAYVNDVEVSATFDFGVPITGIDWRPHLKIMDAYSDSAIKTSTGGSTTYTTVLENPFYATVGIASFTTSDSVTITSSNDLENWSAVASGTSTPKTVPSERQGDRYWKLVYSYGCVNSIIPVAKGNVHLATEPGNGDTVAVTYQPDAVAKDASHTIKDITVVLNFAEYTP